MTKTVDLAYEKSGNGKAIVLLHGFPLDHTIWNAVSRILSRELTVITPDLRGYGGSPSAASFSMEAMADDVDALLGKLGIEKALLAGHSMGGYISLVFASLYPQRLAGLALVNSICTADNAEKRAGRLKLAELVERNGPEEVVKASLNQYSPVEAVRNRVHPLILRAPAATVSGCLRGMAQRGDTCAVLAGLNVPGMVIYGNQDALIPAERSLEMADSIPQGEAVCVHGGGHLTMLEQPERVAEALLKLAQRSAY